MAKRLTDNIITGHDPRLGLSFYYSPHFDMNIWRRGSSLTGERTKKDPAFKGFRQSSSRLKQASPIAASLYKLVPKDIKEFTLYRTLTGEAIKMLKEGIEAVVISETLKRKYINPLLEAPIKTSEKRRVRGSLTRETLKGMSDFTSFPKIPATVSKISKHRRSILLQKIIAGHSAGEYFSSAVSELLPQSDIDISAAPIHETKLPKRLTKTIHGLIFLGRLPECKKLKLWIRPA